MKRSWKAGIKKQTVILGIWAAAGALLTGCKAAGGSGTGNRLRPLELSSLEYTGRLELEYAEQFAVDLYQDGFQVLTVADGSRMLLVPEGKEAPEDVPEETAVLYQPVRNIYLAASAAMDMFRALDAFDPAFRDGCRRLVHQRGQGGHEKREDPLCRKIQRPGL